MELKGFLFFSFLGFLFSFYILKDKERDYFWFTRIFILFASLLFIFPTLYVLNESFPEYIYFKDFGFVLKFRLDQASILFIWLNVFLYIFLYFFVKLDFKNHLFNGLMLMLFCVNNLFFLAGDTLTFFIFWEAMLIPATLLLWYFSKENPKRIALEFLIYNFGFSTFLLLGILALYKYNQSFDFNLKGLSDAKWIASFLYIGIMVKTPVFPLHGWLLNTYYNLPSPVTAIFSGILSKYAIYGFFRLYEKASLSLSFLLFLTIFSALYAGFLAWSNRDLKKIFTYMSMSHLNVMLAGCLAMLPYLSPYLIIPFGLFHGFLAFALFIFVYHMEKTAGILSIDEYGSLTLTKPVYTFFITAFLLVLAGFPLFGYFYIEFTMLSFVFKFSLISGFLLSLGIAVNLIYKSIVFYKLIFVKKEGPGSKKLKDLSLSYTILFFLVFLVVIILTLYLSPLLKFLTEGGV
ncbi:MAG: proton-conducting transporter membrane subunit [Caldimicrobium sp.]